MSIESIKERWAKATWPPLTDIAALLAVAEAARDLNLRITSLGGGRYSWEFTADPAAIEGLIAALDVLAVSS